MLSAGGGGEVVECPRVVGRWGLVRVGVVIQAGIVCLYLQFVHGGER